MGKTCLQVTNPKNLKKYSVEFMVVKENCKSVLGAKASLLVKLFQVNKENIFAFKSLHETILPVQSQPLREEQFTREYAEVFKST